MALRSIYVHVKSWYTPRFAQERLWSAIVIFAIAVTYTLGRFPGLEWHSAYTGQTYKILHPESFPNDPFMPTINPISISSYYWIVRLAGEIWLDDRFTIFVYFGLVILALMGIDRTAQVLGANRLTERVLILAFFAADHTYRDALGQIVTYADFYAGTFAGVVVIWLFYLLFAGAAPWRIAACILLLWSLNPKWAWFPTIVATVLLLRERLTVRQQAVALGGAIAVGVVAYVTYYFLLRTPGSLHVALFDRLVDMENSEVNPLLDRPVANLMYFILLGLGVWFAPPAPQANRVRIIMGMGVLLWVLGGLYLTYTPDFLKFPYIVPLAFNRATQWPSYVGLLALAVGVCLRLREESWWKQLASAVLLLAVHIGWTGSRSLAALVAPAILVAGAEVIVVDWKLFSAKGERRALLNRFQFYIPAVLTVTLVLIGVSQNSLLTIRRASASAFESLMRYGVIGDNPSAQWVGVNEYIRTQTPDGAVILPITTYDYPWRPGIGQNNFLRTRTGRSLPYGSEWAVLFDYPLLERAHQNNIQSGLLGVGLKIRDFEVINAGLAYFSPDYLVVVNSEVLWLSRGLRGYRLKDSVDQYTIFERSIQP